MATRLSLAILAIAASALFQTTAGQTTHVVGDGLGWLVPPGGSLAYSTWADLQTFAVGDILVFNFKTGEQDVARVTKEAFDTCNSTSPISLQTTGPANFTLDTAGDYYFIGTIDRHCTLGQKLAINVPAPGPASSPAPHHPPSTPAPLSPRGPVTYIVGDDLGWLVPPGGSVAYATWAYNKTFMVGDTLVFNFKTGQQDVARVTKEAFDTCNSTSPISLQTTGPVNFTLDTVGDYYFIGTMDRHCTLGQKLAINVPAPGPASSPAPYHPPSTPPHVSPRAPVTYIVGDDLGWLVPPGGSVAYATWAYNKTFMVGDTLVFNFKTGEQDVARVTKEAFDTCNSSSPISLQTTGPANFTLDTAGDYYFIGTMDRHCTLGQKLSINVPALGPASSPAPHHPPSTPAPTPPRGSMTYIVGDDLGWLVPPGGSVAYATWAYNKTFIVGDTLVFNFVNGSQDVAVVTKEAYESCNTSSTITILTVSPAQILLNTTGEHFFTSTYPRHCTLGQRLAINVTASSTASPPPSTATPPSSTATPPSHAATPPSSTITTGPASGPAAGGPMAPPPSSSAPPRIAAGFFITTLLSIAMAFY